MARIDLKTATLVTDNYDDNALVISNDADAFTQHDTVERAGTDAISIPFPKFNDGRGFSLANILRRQHRFTGELRATGHVLPDQAVHLLRAGFDTAEISAPAALPAWQAALGRYRGNYQSALRNPRELRRNADRGAIDVTVIHAGDRDLASLAAHAP